jgi:hypothetical protein
MKRVVLLLVGVAAAVLWALCPREATGHEVLRTTVLFDREIVSILNRRCVMCHSENGPAFPLETYEQTFLRGRAIRDHVLARQMPPWPAVPGYGLFSNDNGLTLRETQFIVAWVEGSGPRSGASVFLNVVDPTAAPPPEIRARAHVAQWQLGKPDLTRQLAANTVEPRREAVTRTVIDLGLTSERRVRAIEFMPGDRRVVRAASFKVQETGQWLGSWTPWYGFRDLPSGVAYRLPAGSHIVADIHYHGTSANVVDQGQLGLFFSDEPSAVDPSDLVLDATVQPGASTEPQRLHAEVRLAQDTYLMALSPNIQAGVQSIELSARRPDGGTQVLLFAKDFSFDWPTPYVLSRPVLVPSGAVLTLTAYAAKSGDVHAADLVSLTVSKFSK